MDGIVELRGFLYLDEAAESLSSTMGRPVGVYELCDLAILHEIVMSVFFPVGVMARELTFDGGSVAGKILADDGELEPDTICSGVWDVYTPGQGARRIARDSERLTTGGGKSVEGMYVRKGDRVCRLIDGSGASALVIRLMELDRLGEKLDVVLGRSAAPEQSGVAINPLPPASTRETQAERIEFCLDELERFATSEGLPFDRKAMPGRKTDFDAFLRKADIAFTKLGKSTLAGYIKDAECAWPGNLGPNPASSPFYENALKWMRKPGVNAKQCG